MELDCNSSHTWSTVRWPVNHTWFEFLKVVCNYPPNNASWEVIDAFLQNNYQARLESHCHPVVVLFPCSHSQAAFELAWGKYQSSSSSSSR